AGDAVLHELERTYHLVGLEAGRGPVIAFGGGAEGRERGKRHAMEDDAAAPFHPPVSRNISMRRLALAKGSSAIFNWRSAKPATSLMRVSSMPARTSM